MAPPPPDLPHSSPWVAQLMRYLLVGGVAFIGDFGLLVGLTELAGWHYRVAAATAFLGGLVINYGLAIRFVFTHRRVRNRFAEFFAYGIIGLVGVGLNDLILFTSYEVLGIHYTVGKIVSAAVVVGFNFTSRKLLLFTPAPPPK